MRSTSLKILKLLVIVDIVIAVTAVLLFDMKVVYNTQIGFISSTLVMVASMISYRRMVNTRVEHNIITIDETKDVIDSVEDPYDLYSEAVIEDKKDMVEAVKEEKKRLKENQRTLYETLKDTKAALSLYRLGAYALLILGFLYLNRQGLLYIPAYILALSIPPVIIVTLLIRDKANYSQD